MPTGISCGLAMEFCKGIFEAVLTVRKLFPQEQIIIALRLERREDAPVIHLKFKKRRKMTRSRRGMTMVSVFGDATAKMPRLSPGGGRATFARFLVYLTSKFRAAVI